MKIQRRTLFLIGAGAIALALAGGGATVAIVQITSSKQRVRQAFRDAAARWGIDPDWVDALVHHESGWDQTKTNMDPKADGKYGGAWGASQILLTNLQAHGITDAQAYLQDLATQAELTAQMIAALNPQSIEELGAGWNAGPSFTHRPNSAPASTRTRYIPQLLASLNLVQQQTFSGLRVAGWMDAGARLAA